jgi:hypothetical protein
MKMLHNFLNFLPFIILRHLKERKGKESRKNFDIIVKGKTFTYCVLSRMENVFPPTIDVKEEKQRAGEKEWQKPKSSCACKQEKEGKSLSTEFSGRDFPLH